MLLIRGLRRRVALAKPQPLSRKEAHDQPKHSLSADQDGDGILGPFQLAENQAAHQIQEGDCWRG